MKSYHFYITYHFNIRIEDALCNPDREIESMFHGENGEQLSAADIRRDLLDMFKQGKKVIPVGEPCEGWSDVTGCPGHEMKEDKQ